MSKPKLLAQVKSIADGGWQVLAPSVGWWRSHPRAGALLGAGSVIGELTILGRRKILELPASVAGAVDGDLPKARIVAVEFGQRLFTLRAIDTMTGSDAQSSADGSSAAVADALPQGCLAITAPTDGVFYRRPSPDAPPFAEVGATIRSGQTVGLVEVMKTFNPIAYGGPSLPQQVEVVEVRAEDGDEVEAGQLLLVARPA